MKNLWIVDIKVNSNGQFKEPFHVEIVKTTVRAALGKAWEAWREAHGGTHVETATINLKRG